MNMIITHAGSFHADESMAIALLERFYFHQPLRMTLDLPQDEVLGLLAGNHLTMPSVYFPDGTEDCRQGVPIVRTRDATLLQKANETKSCFVIDVGGVYNEDMHNFDHHQKSMTDTWNDGTPYSSTGLVWTFLRKHGYVDLPSKVCSELEEKIIKPLDMHDNGLMVAPLAAQLGGYNRSSDDPRVQDEQFGKGLGLMREALDNAIFAATLKLEATQVLTKQWKRAQEKGDTVVVLTKPVAYHDCTGLLKELSAGQASMIVIPGQGNRYSVISMGLDTPFSIKCPCPQEWRGQMNKTVSIDGKPIMIRFAHKTGFMCVVEGSLQDAHRVARFVATQNLTSSAKMSNPSVVPTPAQHPRSPDIAGSRPVQRHDHVTQDRHPTHARTDEVAPSKRPSRSEQQAKASQVSVTHKPSRSPKP